MSRATNYASFANTDGKMVSVFHSQEDGTYFLAVNGSRIGAKSGDVNNAFRLALVWWPNATLVKPHYYAQEAYANALGFQYAANGIAAGDAERESPLSGEWAGEPSPRDIFVSVVGREPRDMPEAYMEDEFSDVEQFADDWQDGYRAAYAMAYDAGVLTAPDADDEV